MLWVGSFSQVLGVIGVQVPIRSRVRGAVWWPSSRCMTLILALHEIARLATVCRKSCGLSPQVPGTGWRGRPQTLCARLTPLHEQVVGVRVEVDEGSGPSLSNHALRVTPFPKSSLRTRHSSLNVVKPSLSPSSRTSIS